MARQLRVDFAGARHHVMNRGLRHQRIFFGDGDAIAFLGLLEALPDRFGVEVHGYALMPNHYHLMLRSVRGNLAEAMRWLGLIWTQRLNRRHEHWDGPVFRGRYRSCVVDSELYWGHLLAYLHLNPVRGRVALDADRAVWTSHQTYLGTSRADWVTTSELRDWFGSAASYRQYLEDVQRRRTTDPDGFEAVVDWGVRGQVVTPDSRAVGRWSEPEYEEVLAGIFGRSGYTLRPRTGRFGSPETAFFAWAMHRVAGVSQAELARRLGLGPSTVQKRVAVVDRNRHRDLSLWRLGGRFDRSLRALEARRRQRVA